jgi:D-amino-acid oxidase
MAKEALVLGCGVSGLTTATVLQESGFEVTIWAKDLPPDTTSNVAAAIWLPYKAYPQNKVHLWGKRTFEVFLELAKFSESGVRLVSGKKYFRRPMGLPWWNGFVPSFRRLTQDELTGGRKSGFSFQLPVIDTSLYMTHYLPDRFKKAGGKIVKKELKRLEEAWEESDLIINCTGLGSRTLVSDTRLHPIRGQVVRIELPEKAEFWLESDHPGGDVYVIPRGADCILGGVAQKGNWSEEADPLVAKAIWDRCTEVFPALKSRKILEHKVGLRPGRDEVRLELETFSDGRKLVHNYGHGGSGVTLSWGCAENVYALCTTKEKAL